MGSRAEVAARLSLSEKQITNLVKSGRLSDGTEFPSRVEGRSRTFPLDRCFDWYVRYKQEEALQRAAPTKPDSMKDATLRQAIADAEIAELKLAGLRNQVAPVEEHRKELTRILGKVRARLVAIDGVYASQFLNLPDMPAAAAKLREMATAVLRELQGVAGGAEDEAPEEAQAAEAG